MSLTLRTISREQHLAYIQSLPSASRMTVIRERRRTPPNQSLLSPIQMPPGQSSSRPVLFKFMPLHELRGC